MLQPVLVTELVPDTLAPMSAVRVPWLASECRRNAAGRMFDQRRRRSVVVGAS
jgi:hypothetical protein